MKIDSRDIYAGIPLLRIRRMLKRSSDKFSWNGFFIRTELAVTAPTAMRVIAELLQDGYIEPASQRSESWRNTQKGNALACATAAPLLHRKSADRILTGFLDRVRQINSSPCAFMYTIEKVVLLGSMLSDKDRVSDIDLSFQLVRKPVADVLEAGEVRVAAARSKGRQFSSFFDELGWPEREVLLFLRNRSRALSFISWDEKWIETQSHRIIYER